MAISSRLALWEQKERGFIKQLVRETEKESKEARRRKDAALASPEREAPEVSATQASSKTNSGPQPGSPSNSQDATAPGGDSQGPGAPHPGPVTNVDTGEPSRRVPPGRRGVRRGDVLLMVAKLDPELAKPRDSPPSRTPAPATDPGGAESKAAPPTSSGELTPPGSLGGAGRGTQEQSGQETMGKGSRTPPNKQPEGGEPQGQEEKRTRPQAPGAGAGGRTHTAEGGAPQNKTEKGGLPQDTGDQSRTEPQVPARKWGTSWSKKSKGVGPQNKKDKTGVPQTKKEERGAGQGLGGQAGDVAGMLGKAGGPLPVAGETGVPQKVEVPKEAVGTQSLAEKGCSVSQKPAPQGLSLEASGSEDRPDLRVQGAQEPCEIAEHRVPEPQLQPVLETLVDQPLDQKPAEQGLEPQEQDSGDRSPEDAGQAAEGRWYEAEKVWLAQKDGFVLATVLKPDEGTADLPAGRVRLCLDSDKSVMEVDEDQVHRANPPELDQAEDLASLASINESSVLNTLLCRYGAQRPHTCAGPNLIVLRPPGPAESWAGQVPRARWDGLPAHVGSLARRAYWALLSQRRDQSVVALGRSGAGKTLCCQQVLEHLVGMAGSVDGRVSVDKIRAAFTVLRAFGSVSTAHSCAATKFVLAMSLDFSATGRITAAQLQTMLLETSRVGRRPEGEGNFQVFSQMLAGLDLELRTELNLHQMADCHAFGMGDWSKPEEKLEAAAAFAQLRAAMDVLGISQGEQRAAWCLLAAIYHLGAAGACKVGRKQFMRFEWANHSAEALGCEFEDLNTATFKHHLRQIIQQATAGPGHRAEEGEASTGLKMTGVECVEGMAAGLYQELFSAMISLINRSFCSQHLSMASIMVVDAPGFQNPRHQGRGRAATFEELCHNYAQERLQLLFYQRTFVSTLERYREEGIPVHFDLPESSPETTVALMDQNPSQAHMPGGRGSEDARGLFWLLDEEVRVEGSSDSVVLERLRAAFEKKGAGEEGPLALRACEQPLQSEVFHQLGHDPVRYDLTGWLHRAKPNLSALDAPQLLHQSKREELRSLFQARAKLPPVCRALAGLEAASPQALQRNHVVRRAFASSLAAVKRKAPCAQIKLQMDALVGLLSRSQLRFIHCLLPVPKVVSGAGQGSCENQVDAGRPQALDIPALRVQLAGSHILEALRLHRTGFADHMGLPQFRRRFQALDPALLKRLAAAPEGVDERQAVVELLNTVDLEAHAVALGHSQVFLKAGVVSKLEKQREKMVAGCIVLFQAVCRGFLARQEFKKLKIHRLAARCIRKNVAVFLAVKGWPWWQLLASLRPLLSTTVGTEQLRAKEEELSMLRRKLEKSEGLMNELRQNSDLQQNKIADLTAELADERFKGDVVCRVLESERAERLQAIRQVQELKNKCEQVQKSLGDTEKRLEEAEQKVQLRDLESKHTYDDEWQIRLDCAHMENEFLRKRLQQCEERLDSELASKKELEQKLGELQNVYEEAKKTAHQLKKRCHHLTWDLDDARALLENQQSRNHELEKKQKKFDMQLAQALGGAVIEKNLREKVAQESSHMHWKLGWLQQQLQQKELETGKLQQEVERLREQKQELLASATLRGEGVAAELKVKLWEMESKMLEQTEAQRQQEGSIRQLEQVRERLELELERMKQMYQKGREDQEEELEDVRQSCQKRLWQLEMQLEQEHEDKQMALHEKRDLETLIGSLCEQIGHRDFDVEKRLRRDLRRTHALLSDVQLLLASMDDGKTSARKEELEKMRSQLEQSETKCEDALKTQKALTAELEAMHSELEGMARSKSLVDEQLFRLQFEKAGLLKRIDEDQDDLNDLMQKHKDLIAQSSEDIGQIQELHLQLEEARKEKQKLQEQVAQTRIEYLEQSTVNRAIVSRQEAVVCDLESKTEFQKVQIKRFEVLVIRLRDSLIKMGEELSQATMAESQQRENSQYYQRRLEEMKAEMEELVQREAEASRRCMELEKYVEELAAMRQTLQTDLETSIRRIADLQAALEEVASSDSDTESVQTAVDCSSRGRKETDNASIISFQPEGSLQSWPSCTLSLATDIVRTPSRQSASSSHVLSPRTKEEAREAGRSAPASVALGRAWEGGPQASRGDGVSLHSPCHPEDQRMASERPGAVSPSLGSLSPARSPLPRDKLPSPSAALSEFVEGLRRKRAQRGGQGSPLHLEDWPTLPIYQTTGASALRRGRASSDEGALSLGLGAQAPLGAEGGSGLLRCASLKSIPSEGATGTELLPDRTKTRFSSCESLLETGMSLGRQLSPPCARRDPLLSPSLRPRRRCLEASVDDAGSLDLGTEPLVFQNRQFAHLMEEPLSGDSFSWKLPSLHYGRQSQGDLDDFLPAIRKPATPPSLAQAAKDKQHPTVHFEMEESDPSFISAMKTWETKSPGPQEGPAHLSDSSSSSSSIVSLKSNPSAKSRPSLPRLQGDGGERTSPERPELGTTRRDKDVESIMKKYLQK